MLPEMLSKFERSVFFFVFKILNRTLDCFFVFPLFICFDPLTWDNLQDQHSVMFRRSLAALCFCFIVILKLARSNISPLLMFT